MMFQLAAGASLAKKMNAICLAYATPNYWATYPDNCFLPVYLSAFKQTLFRNFEFVKDLPCNYTLCEEVEFTYNELPQLENICLSGYFQSEKYFHIPLVRRLFQMEEGTKQRLYLLYGDILHFHPVSINIRRGDYLQVQNFHPVCPLSFFEKAIDMLGKDRHYIITSDDIKWCKCNFQDKNFHVIDNITPVDNLYLQSLCRDHIISNSTYSWWGAWLDDNPKKRVIYPKHWFGTALQHLSTKDLIPTKWIPI